MRRFNPMNFPRSVLIEALQHRLCPGKCHRIILPSHDEHLVNVQVVARSLHVHHAVVLVRCHLQLADPVVCLIVGQVEEERFADRRLRVPYVALTGLKS